MKRPSNLDECYELLGELCNGLITEGKFSRLEQLLAADASARKMYFDYLDVHLELSSQGLSGKHRLPLSQLKQELDRATNLSGVEVDKPGGVPQSSPSLNHSNFINLPSVLSYGIVMALTMFAILGIQRWSGQGQTDRAEADPAVPDFVATLLKSADCDWGGDHPPRFDGERLLSRDIELVEGLAELGFDTGVRIVLQGPARLTIDSSSNALLHSGKLVLYGSESAEPFTLNTPYSTLLDIGTEYGASVNEDKTADVRVFSGEVHVKPRATVGDSTLNQILGEGEAASVDVSGLVQSASDEINFVRKIPKSKFPKMSQESQLLAWERFDYQTPKLGNGNGGSGFKGPWRRGLADKGPSTAIVNREISLSESAGTTDDDGDGTAVENEEPEKAETELEAEGDIGGGSGTLEFAGGQASARTLAKPIRLDVDGVHYFSFLVQKVKKAPAGKSQYVSVSFRTSDVAKAAESRLHFGLTSENFVMMSHGKKQSIVPPALATGDTFLFVAKIVAGKDEPDQLKLRVYGAVDEVSDSETLVWNCETAPVLESSVFDELFVYCARDGSFRVDDIRVGTTWGAVTSPDVWNETKGE